MQNRNIIILGCLAALILRLVLAAHAPTLAPEAYDTVRQADHIAQTGVPFIHDPLSTETNARIVLPVFPYLVAFGTLLVGSYAYILIPNLLAVLLHAAVFLLVLELTQQEGLATIAMIASIAIPSYLTATMLTASSLSLAIPLIFFILILYIKLRKSKEKRNVLLISTVVLLATNPIGLIIVPVFLVATALAALRHARDLTIQYEFALFTTFLAAWAYLLLYKRVIIAHGLSAVHGNIPTEIASKLYGAPQLLAFGIAVGIVPFGLAIYAAYKEGIARHPSVQTAVALTLTAFVATLLGAISTTTGVTIVAIGCVVLGAVGLDRITRYWGTMRETTLPRVVASVLVFLFIVTSVVPTVIAGVAATETTIPPDVLTAGRWLHDNSLPSAIILAPPEWGDALAWTSGRPVFINDNYLEDADSERTYTDATNALAGERLGAITHQHRIQYVVTNTPPPSACLNTVSGDTVKVLKVLC